MSPNDIRLFLTLAFQQNVGGQVLRYTTKKLYEDSVANLNRYKMKLDPLIEASLSLICNLDSPTQIRQTAPLTFQVTENPSTNMPLHFFSSHYFTLQAYAKAHDLNATQYMLDYEIYTHILTHAARLTLTKSPVYYLPSSTRQIASRLHMNKETVLKHMLRMSNLSVVTYLPAKTTQHSLFIIAGDAKTSDVLDALTEKKKIKPELFCTPYGLKIRGIDLSPEEILKKEIENPDRR